MNNKKNIEYYYIINIYIDLLEKRNEKPLELLGKTFFFINNENEIYREETKIYLNKNNFYKFSGKYHFYSSIFNNFSFKDEKELISSFFNEINYSFFKEDMIKFYNENYGLLTIDPKQIISVFIKKIKNNPFKNLIDQLEI